MDHYRTHAKAAFTCRHFGSSRQTFYRWKRRYDPHALTTLEDRSHRPHRRRHYPRWGKDKLVVLLHRQGWRVSTSMVGRILTALKRRGRLLEPPRRALSAQRRPGPRPYAVRKPKDYSVSQPGDLVQVDTLDVPPLPGVVLKQFSARDVISRGDVVVAPRRATSVTAAQFLDTLQARRPFPVRALQGDGGSEFTATFEQACQQRGLHLFVLPPRPPKLNGAVERAQRTPTEEFYEVSPCSWQLAALNRELRAWEQVYNTVRPPQALGYLTPQQFLQHCESQRKEPECH